MKNTCGEELIALAGTLSVTIADGKSIEDLITFIEFFGLVRHNLEIIKCQRIACKVEEKKHDKK